MSDEKVFCVVCDRPEPASGFDAEGRCTDCCIWGSETIIRLASAAIDRIDRICRSAERALTSGAPGS